MKTVKFEANWETIYQYIGRALFYATEYNVACECEFNGGKFTVTPKSNMDSAYEDWQLDMKRQVAAYYNSEEYKSKQRELEIKKSQKAKEMSSLIEEFKGFNLAFNDKAEKIAFLNWIIKYQPYSDYIYSDEKNDAFVVSELKKAGYKKDENVGNKDMTSDEFFRYIIGQAISTMEVLAMHGFVASMATRWIKENN